MESHSNADPLLLRYQALLTMPDSLSHSGNLDEFFRKIPERLKTVVSFDFLSLVLRDPGRDVMHLNTWEGIPGPSAPIEHTVSEAVARWVWDHQEPLLCPVVESESRFPKVMETLGARGIRCYCMLPLTASGPISQACSVSRPSLLRRTTALKTNTGEGSRGAATESGPAFQWRESMLVRKLPEDE